jgi:hypothetical protein
MFVADGANMLVRSALLQSTFVVVTVCVARMGSSSLAAHQVIAQMWLLTSYIVDGFAAAGTVLGSRLAALKTVDARGLRCAPPLRLGCRYVQLTLAWQGRQCLHPEHRESSALLDRARALALFYLGAGSILMPVTPQRRPEPLHVLACIPVLWAGL